MTLVIYLYEQVIQDLRRAAMAMEQGDIELRTKQINHALSVIGHLQGTLDRKQGGQVGRNLDRLYCSVRARLIEAHVGVSVEILYEQITNLLSVREAWIEVDKATSKVTAPAATNSGGDSTTFNANRSESPVWRG